MKVRFAAVAVCLTALTLSALAQQELAIEAFHDSGKLVFNAMSSTNVAKYSVEWSPGSDGPWTNFTGQDGQWLDQIPGNMAGVITASVPMFYRVRVSYRAPDMVLIPQGFYEQRDPGVTYSVVNEVPFWMDTHEITGAEYDDVYQWAITNGYGFYVAGSSKATNHPVEATWHNAVKWCNARSERDNLTPCYTSSGQVYRAGIDNSVVCAWTAQGYRLPTEIEWEWAARGGGEGVIAGPLHNFPWTDSEWISHDRANYRAEVGGGWDESSTSGYHPDYCAEDECPDFPGPSSPYTSPVGSFAPNNYGLYDMAGNVAEWCWQNVEPYWPNTFIARGGGWEFWAADCRCIGRQGWGEGDPRGFRTIIPEGM